MKSWMIVVFSCLAFLGIAQKKVNVQAGFAVGGYDVVSYFEGNPVKGIDDYVYIYKDVMYRFSSNAHLEAFKSDPEKYLPEYGGYCAYAMAEGKKVAINPKTYELKSGKLYLFFNKGGTNTLELWIKEGSENLRKKADEAWEKLNSSK